MDDLVQFLRDRLDEDAALAASGETWSAFEESPHGTRRVDVDHSIERVVACTRSWRGLHIARHDPARVLAELEAKRRLVALHARPHHQCVTEDGPTQWHAADPCATLRLLALPYADRPGYREEWRP